MRDYFGHDDEIPNGFQDADIEMAELEEAARERKTARLFQEPTGKWHYCDDALEYLDARGTGYDTKKLADIEG